MAWSAHKDPEQMKERFDTKEEFERKADMFVDLIKKSKHMIVFSGAGISTSAGIPDFRGPQGVWTLRDQGKAAPAGKSSLKAVPTPSHMAIYKLLEANICKFVVSQNTDGLHRKSGINPAKLAELHGNTNLERCSNCGKEYLRDFRTRTAAGVHDHDTGRKCALCQGKLMDTIINFGESLPQNHLQNAFMQAELADLCLVLGSSLTVTPAADIPRKVGAKKNGNLVVCNLQNTPLDHLASIRIYSKCDELMKYVLQKLNLEIPVWKLKRRITLGTRCGWNTSIGAQEWKIYVKAVDEDGIPASIFKRVRFYFPEGYSPREISLENEPFEISSSQLKKEEGKVKDGETRITMSFFGHYNEPDLTEHKLLTDKDGKFEKICHFSFNPFTGIWETEKVIDS